MQKYKTRIELSGPVTEFLLCTDKECIIPEHGTEFYLASDVDAAFDACKAALREAEAILGGEYDTHHGPLFERIEKARSLMDRST
jgi:hypothetical protein